MLPTDASKPAKSLVLFNGADDKEAAYWGMFKTLFGFADAENRNPDVDADAENPFSGKGGLHEVAEKEKFSLQQEHDVVDPFEDLEQNLLMKIRQPSIILVEDAEDVPFELLDDQSLTRVVFTSPASVQQVGKLLHPSVPRWYFGELTSSFARRWVEASCGDFGLVKLRAPADKDLRRRMTEKLSVRIEDVIEVDSHQGVTTSEKDESATSGNDVAAVDHAEGGVFFGRGNDAGSSEKKSSGDDVVQARLEEAVAANFVSTCKIQTGPHCIPEDLRLKEIEERQQSWQTVSLYWQARDFCFEAGSQELVRQFADTQRVRYERELVGHIGTLRSQAALLLLWDRLRVGLRFSNTMNGHVAGRAHGQWKELTSGSGRGMHMLGWEKMTSAEWEEKDDLNSILRWADSVADRQSAKVQWAKWILALRETLTNEMLVDGEVDPACLAALDLCFAPGMLSSEFEEFAVGNLAKWLRM